MLRYALNYAKRYGIRRVVKKIFKYIFIVSIIFFINNNVNAKTYQCVDITTEDPMLYDLSFSTFSNGTTTYHVGNVGQSIDFSPNAFAFGFIPNSEINGAQDITLTLISNNQHFYKDNWNFNLRWFFGSSTHSYDTYNILNGYPYLQNLPSYIDYKTGYDSRGLDNLPLTNKTRDWGKIEISFPVSSQASSLKYATLFLISANNNALAHKPFTIDSCYFTVPNSSGGGGGGSSADLTETNERLNEIAQKQQETNDKLDDLNDNITSDDTTNSESQLNTLLETEITEFGPLTQLLGLPISVLNKIITLLGNANVTGYCPTIEADLPFDLGTLEIPCFEELLIDKIGDIGFVLWNLIGTIASAFILYQNFFVLYTETEKMTNFKEVTIKEW